MNINAENERIKKKYLDQLRDADGLSEASIVSISRALHKYDIYSKSDSYKLITPTKAKAFREQLVGEKGIKRVRSLTTAYGVLRHVCSFFRWLSEEPGFKRQELRDSVGYLKLDKNQIREATASRYQEAPSLDYVIKLTQSIKSADEISRRDRAIIAFLFLTGMRDLAVVTLPIGCFDRQANLIHQDPSKGVRTKNRKYICSRLLPFDLAMVQIVLEWFDFLVNQKGFKESDPLFPRTRVVQSGLSLSFEALGVEPVFWQTAGPIRSILQDRSKHANLPYFKPHLFRHGSIRLSAHYCKTPEQLRALSQNYGHENIGTTLSTYGKFDTHQVIDIVGKMDFKLTAESSSSETQIDKMIELLTEMKKKGIHISGQAGQ